MQAFQTDTAAQPISIQLLQTQQKPHVTEVWHNAEKHSLLINVNTSAWYYTFHLVSVPVPFAYSVNIPSV